MEKGCESFIYATLTLDVQQESRIFTPKKKTKTDRPWLCARVTPKVVESCSKA